MENPQPDMSAIEKTDEEIWRAIRHLDLINNLTLATSHA